ncbi:MAG TPA: glycosyltransferase family 39 protein [Candidatus Paceibacterota bacterium]|nr:glycosyltransferase family 39 protein [Candidatus Paceibacterota bacterium]
MPQSINENSRARGATLVCLVLSALALGIRFVGLSQPYHQDEYKWAFIVDPAHNAGEAAIPHPPLAEWLYHLTGAHFGYDHLRLLPFFASFIFGILLFYIVRRVYGLRAASLALFFWAIDLYAVLASLQIDIDGVLLPIFTLCMLGGYELWKTEKFSARVIALFAIGIVGGAFTKLSFVLAPVAIALDLLWRYRHLILQRPRILREILVGFCALAVLALIGFFALKNVPIFSYAEKFMHVGGRDYFELMFLTAKAVIYLSPFLILGALLGLKRFHRFSLWFWFLAASILFYAVAFDFTHTTLDRYWMVLILPCVVITAGVLGEQIENLRVGTNEIALGAVCAALVALASAIVFSAPKVVIPLQPKDAFLHAFFSGHWSFLIPLSGGSGPLGFYLPLDGIAFLGLLSLAGAIILLCAQSRRAQIFAMCLVVCAGIVYNGFGVAEYLGGFFYGSAPAVYAQLITRVNGDPSIPQVITYNDIGAYELTLSGKYFKRFYTDPMFAQTNVGKFSSYDGYYMVLDMPAINTDSAYWKYFQQCKNVYQTNDKQISGYIFDCRGVRFTS